MAAVARGGVVAVTGAAGFVGGHVVAEALARGHRVRACVRDIDDETKVGFLRSLPPHASGRLTLHAADLDDAGCFDDIFRGADGVVHVSHLSSYDDLELVRRTCAHVIASIEASESVQRVVLTSSIAAVMSEADVTELARRPVIDEDRRPDESHPKRTPERGQGYSIGKVIAEESFADAAARNGGWDAITVCPGDNIGPILSAHQRTGAWQHLIGRMLEGRCEIFHGTGPYRPWMPVDVRDDAACHVGLLESETVDNGQRFLAWSAETHDYADIVRAIDRVLPELRHEPGPIADPAPDRWRAREQEFRAIWSGLELHNERVRAATGVEFRPFDETLRDCVESLLAIGGVVARRRGA